MPKSNRFTIFLSSDVLKKLDDYADRFATGSEEKNRSKVISNLITRFVPDTSKVSD